MNIKDKNTIMITHKTDREEVPRDQPEFAEKLDLAKRGIKKYKNSLVALAR